MNETVEETEQEKNVIGVIGNGFVGSAVNNFFSKRGHDVRVYDKYQEEFSSAENLMSVMNTEYLFLCLPTPYIPDFGFNITALEDTCKILQSRKYVGTVIIKSTVEPGTIRSLSQRFNNLMIVHNPEFLTARTADFDFENQRHIVIGGLHVKVCMNVYSLYKKEFGDTPITICSSEQSESMKLFCNAFYAIKVQAFNEFAFMCKRMNIEYNEVRDMMLKNGWINSMHTLVPGTDGEFSYGGECFPKDTNALNHFMKRLGTPHGVLEACIEERNKIRGE